MTRALLSAVRALFVMTLCAGASVAAERIVEWDDLRLPATAEDNPFEKLTDEQLDDLRYLALTSLLESRGIETSDENRAKNAERIKRLATQSIDAAAILKLREDMIVNRTRAASRGVDALDGQAVKLVGYLLPAGAENGKVTEFLLVPWVGACSHTPPPPPNQIVRVRPSQPYAADQWYERVSISGVLQIRPQTRELFVIDGAINVTSTYAMEAASVMSATTSSK